MKAKFNILALMAALAAVMGLTAGSALAGPTFKNHRPAVSNHSSKRVERVTIKGKHFVAKGIMRTTTKVSAGPASFASAIPMSVQDDGTSTEVTSQDMMLTIGKTAVSANDIETGKVVILSYVWAKGVSKKQMAHAPCRWIGKGTDVPVYTNTGFGAHGMVKFLDTRHVMVCFVAGHWRKVKCGNIIFFSAPPSVTLKASQVIMVRNFAKVRIHIVARVKVRAVNKNCPGAYAEASSVVDIWINLRVFVRSSGDVITRIFASVKSSASAKASAQVKCEVPPPVTPPPPPPPPPPPAKPPTVTNLTKVQEMYVNETRPNTCADVNVPSGSGTVVFASTIGGWFTPSVFSVSTGFYRLCSTYNAPSEPGTERFKVTAYISGFDPVSALSDPFEILPNPPPPGSPAFTGYEFVG